LADLSPVILTDNSSLVFKNIVEFSMICEITDHMMLYFVFHAHCFVSFKVKSQPRHSTYNHPVIKRSSRCYSTWVLIHFCCENGSACDLTVYLYYKNPSVLLLWMLIVWLCQRPIAANLGHVDAILTSEFWVQPLNLLTSTFRN